MQNNYFVCTLGQAAALNTNPKSYRNISEFLSQQSQHHPLLPAVGFPIPRPNQREWDYRVLSFADVDQGTNVFASRLTTCLGTSRKLATVALLCHSSPEFLFTWLGLIRLGYSVLLIAPQCQPAAILHLCTACEVTDFFYDVAHTERAQQTETLAKEQGTLGLQVTLLPLSGAEDVLDVIQTPLESSVEPLHVDEGSIAYLHHTSGTSSGLPKPIPQSHRAAIGVLPHLPKIPALASFTTTPLYHGGIADLFRCWTSNAMIWLFPGKDVPITARNICECLDVAKTYAATEGLPKVKYFSSVPYVLQMMEADEKGLQLLQDMDIVGVGGAALPAEVGDRLVKSRVNLISRFGSAECGFILSSYRDFAADDDWQYLRNYNPPKLVEFEKREGDLAELIIKPGWPHMAKQNRPDGSFATADLFAAHPTIKDAWLYHSRADSQLTLITGKKFDPAPLEDAIATSPYLDDVLIFGNNRPFPGALLLRSKQSSNMSDQELLGAVRIQVEKLNSESQDHARISFDMLVPLPHQDQPLEKSSKGTIIRRAAEARFEDAINSAYGSQDSDSSLEVSDDDVPQHLIGLIQSMTGQTAELNKDIDLFSYGVDSIACMQLRTRLRRLIPNFEGQLPMSVVEDCGTVRRLTDYVLRKRHGQSDSGGEDEEKLMLDLVKQYGSFTASTLRTATNGSVAKRGVDEVVVLTGATGALGAHVLDLLQKRSDVEAVYCLVRGADEHAARERVSKALEQRGLVSLLTPGAADGKIKVIPSQLSEERLGLDEDVYEYLAENATSIIHVAWTVNFRLKLRSFEKDNIAGVRNLLDLALKSQRSQPPRFTYCSSTAAIMNGTLDASGQLPEVVSSEPSSASPLGYSRSKWVAEHICLEAHNRTNLRGCIAVVRVGQLAGDSTSGVWNTKEAWPMMLSTARLIKCLPDLGDEPLDWLPVDVAAKAFLEAAGPRKEHGEMPVFHVLNPHHEPSWTQMLQWLQKEDQFEIVSPKEWVERLEQAGDSDHSALKLLGLWKESYGRELTEKTARPQFSTTKTSESVQALRNVEPLDKEYVERIWNWIQENVK
ncbi:putative NRPS-like protein biosynthetic cluster [Alternaria ventricosa]|uniref:putative NRPS-like protein biosynthetic cluster n=1 Tax=Alternaria ventricosa TaxID=1187951 RepID=UPI0020C2EB22|nr:putative NRPS-like protein biosynthetic cluster [Alternaria ventricosa]KAI4642096.1 putative NRPS-like protein biosynthetic cluster [Alternaria ventricosa]